MIGIILGAAWLLLFTSKVVTDVFEYHKKKRELLSLPNGEALFAEWHTEWVKNG